MFLFWFCNGLLVSSAVAFLARTKSHIREPALMAMNRREALALTLVGLIAVPDKSNAKPASTFFFDDESVVEPSQMKTNGKTDLNSAFVVSYSMHNKEYSYSFESHLHASSCLAAL